MTTTTFLQQCTFRSDHTHHQSSSFLATSSACTGALALAQKSTKCTPRRATAPSALEVSWRAFLGKSVFHLHAQGFTSGSWKPTNPHHFPPRRRDSDGHPIHHYFPNPRSGLRVVVVLDPRHSLRATRPHDHPDAL